MISLHEPRFNEEDERLVLETLRSTWVSTGGPFVKEFENIFADYVGARHAISVVNGTVAIQLAVEVLKRLNNIKSSFDVLVPTLSFIATANAVCHSGGTPVLIDCMSDSMNISPKQVLAVLEGAYRRDSNGNLVNKSSGNPLLCIMPAHIMGWTCDMDQLRKIADSFNVPVIDDAAEALGSRYFDGTHVGSKSLAAIYSFNGNKILTTGGGGMLVTNDPELAQLARHLSTTAKTDDLRYIHDQVGYNFRMVNILAALGVSQMRRLSQTLVQKRKIADLYSVDAEKYNFKVHKEYFSEPNNWIVNAVFDSEAKREAALSSLLQKKIQCRPLWTPAHRLSFFNDGSRLVRDFSNADKIWKTALSLPSSPHLTEDEALLIKETIGGVK